MQSKNENLSALVDSELDNESLLKNIASDEQLEQKWQSYHFIGDVLRKEVPMGCELNLSESVAKAIDKEPTALAPKKSSTKFVPDLSQVIPLVRQGGQYAIAASVAAAMIIGVQVYNSPTPEEPFELAPTAAIPGIAGRISGVSLEQSRPLSNVDVDVQRRRINALLLDHQTQLKLKSVTTDNSDGESEETSGEVIHPKP